MIGAIGDPLYTPYKKNPVLAVEDLPPRLRAALRGRADAPAPAALDLKEIPPISPPAPPANP
jgi:hypothetical protein